MGIPDDASTTTHPFDRYTSEDLVWFAGDTVGRNAGTVEILGGEVTGAHRPAREGVAGLLFDPMISADGHVKGAVSAWTQSAFFGGQAIRLFGNAVESYNNGVADLNRRYWAAKHDEFGIARVHLGPSATDAEWREARSHRTARVAAADSALLATLGTQRDALESSLDSQATAVAGLLDRGPSDESAVLQLYAAGGLPIGALWLFPGVPWEQVAPPLTGADGAAAARLIQKALDGDASPAEFRQAMLMLDLIGDHALYVQVHGGTLSQGEVEFLHNFYNGMGDRLLELPDYIRDEDINWSEARQNALLATVGTGLLALSNPALWPAPMRFNPMDTSSPYHLPPHLIDQLGYADGQHESYPVPGGRFWYFGLVDFLAGTDPQMMGGRDFSAHLTLTVGSVANDYIYTGRHWEIPDHDRDMRVLLEVSTRNPAANLALLNGDIQDRYYGDATARMLLEHLYHVGWSDDGKAVAGLTDWIAEYAADGDPRHRAMSQEGAAHLIDLVTSTEGGSYQGLGPEPAHYGGLFNFMVDGFRDRDSVGMVNPEIVMSFYRVADAYMPEFAQERGVGGTRFENGQLFLNEGDRVRFFQLIAADENAANALATSANGYVLNTVSAGYAGSGEELPGGRDAGRLLAFLEAGVVNEALDRGADRDDIEAARQARKEQAIGLLLSFAETYGSGVTVGTSTLGSHEYVPYLKTLFHEFVDLDGHARSAPDFDTTLTAPGGGPAPQPNMEYLMTRAMLESAVRDGRVPAADAAPYLTPMNQYDPSKRDENEQHMRDLLLDPDVNVDAAAFINAFDAEYNIARDLTIADDKQEYEDTIEKGELIGDASE